MQAQRDAHEHAAEHPGDHPGAALARSRGGTICGRRRGGTEDHSPRVPDDPEERNVGEYQQQRHANVLRVCEATGNDLELAAEHTGQRQPAEREAAGHEHRPGPRHRSRSVGHTIDLLRAVATQQRSGAEERETLGRCVRDHVQQRTVDLSHVEVLVLDEADRMLDMGFIHDIKRILALLPKQRQSLLFSATFSEEIRTLSSQFLTDPAKKVAGTAMAVSIASGADRANLIAYLKTLEVAAPAAYVNSNTVV